MSRDQVRSLKHSNLSLNRTDQNNRENPECPRRPIRQNVLNLFTMSKILRPKGSQNFMCNLSFFKGPSSAGRATSVALGSAKPWPTRGRAFTSLALVARGRSEEQQSELP